MLGWSSAPLKAVVLKPPRKRSAKGFKYLHKVRLIYITITKLVN